MAEAPAERRLAAIVVADIVGFSRLMAVNEAGTLAAVKQLRADVVDCCVAEHRGRIFKNTGDGLLAEFSSVVQAVECATKVQHELWQRNRILPAEARVELRIGIHVGDVIIDGSDVFGDGVNIAARLEPIAPQGGICLSEDAVRQIHGKLTLDLAARGAQRLKNIAEPVKIWTWLPDPAARSVIVERTGEDRPSLAVLPFVNLAGDHEGEYFVDGLTEEIITQLSRVPGLFLIGRNSAFVYKGKAVPAQEIGRELGVRYLVEGSARRAGNRVRVTVRLVDTETGSQLWSQRYDNEAADILQLQDELTEAIVGTLPGRVEAANMLRIKRKRPEDMAAYDYFLRGKILHPRRSPEDNRLALDALNRALELDPELASAQAWKACVLGQSMIWGWAPDAAQILTESVKAANAALDIDENEVDSHRILCELSIIGRDWDKAEIHHERALALAPNNPLIVAQHGEFLTWIGQPAAAIEWIERAMRLDPYEANQRAHLLGRALYGARRYAEAANAYRRVPVPSPRHFAELAASFAQADMGKEAERAAAEVLRGNPGFSIGAHVAGLAYRFDEDRAHLAEGLRKAGLPE